MKYYFEIVIPVIVVYVVQIVLRYFSSDINIGELFSPDFLLLTIFLSAPLTFPTLYLLIGYYNSDRKLKSENIEEFQGGNIIKVCRYDVKDYGFNFIPWSEFFYYKIRDGENFIYISCLHKDIEKLQFQNLEHSSFPDIPKTIIKLNEANETQVNSFIDQYEKLTNIELNKIVDSGNDYRKEAKEAARTILKNRSNSEKLTD